MTKRSRYSIALFAALLWAPTAAASASYPGVIRDHLGLEDAPLCTLCHADLNGGKGTVVTLFGENLVAMGLEEEDEDALRRLLDELDSTQSDVDGDGTSDVDELLVCGDPNDAGGNNLCGVTEPSFGCAVATSPMSGTSSVATLIGAALAAAALMRRRRG